MKKRSLICKQVAAVSNQWVVVREKTTYVCPTEKSPPTDCLKIGENLEKDSMGRPLEAFFKDSAYLLKDRELFMWGPTNPKSLDSRYLGPIRREELELQLIKKIR